MLKILAASAIVIALFYYLLFNNKKMKTYNHYLKRKKILEDAIKEFVSSEKYVNQNMALAINYEEKKLCVCVMKNGVPVSSVYQFNDITGCEILEDGSEIKTGPQESGSNTGNTPEDKKSIISDLLVIHQKINRIDLKISFNDTQNTSVLANFLFWEASKDSEDYKILLKDALHWHEIIKNIIK
jgi:hypothetical protein